VTSRGGLDSARQVVELHCFSLSWSIYPEGHHRGCQAHMLWVLQGHRQRHPTARVAACQGMWSLPVFELPSSVNVSFLPSRGVASSVIKYFAVE
jgi:hypothetical protein